LANTALLLAANADQQAEYFGKILEGHTATLAFTNTTQFDASGITASYVKQGDHFVLNGDYRFVIDGHTADSIIVAAKHADTHKVALFIISGDEQGLARQWVPTLDQTRKQATISLSNVSVSAANLLSEDAQDVLDKILNIATICLAAEQVGGSQQVLDLTVAYTKERVQFNRPVASFQAVKHKAADMMTKVEAARSGLYYAACIAQEAVVNGPLASE